MTVKYVEQHDSGFRNIVRKREEFFSPSKLTSNYPQKAKDVQKKHLADVVATCHVTPSTERNLCDNCGDFGDYTCVRQGLTQSSNTFAVPQESRC